MANRDGSLSSIEGAVWFDFGEDCQSKRDIPASGWVLRQNINLSIYLSIYVPFTGPWLRWWVRKGFQDGSVVNINPGHPNSTSLYHLAFLFFYFIWKRLKIHTDADSDWSWSFLTYFLFFSWNAAIQLAVVVHRPTSVENILLVHIVLTNCFCWFTNFPAIVDVDSQYIHENVPLNSMLLLN